MLDFIIILLIIGVVIVSLKYDLPEKATNKIYQSGMNEDRKYLLLILVIALQIGIPLFGFYKILMLIN